MAELILHHYAMSPYSEKIRLALGLKGLAWRSVQISPVTPRPALMPMTGGYRRTPVLQVGADIYCDTHLILRVLERLHPEPSVFRDKARVWRRLLPGGGTARPSCPPSAWSPASTPIGSRRISWRNAKA